MILSELSDNAFININESLSETAVVMSSVDSHRNLFNTAKWPLIAYSVLAAAYVASSNFSLFSWHPFLMTLGFITLAGNAALIKKIGGYENTKLHGNFMFIACFLGGVGWYVIHTNKNNMNRAHLTTLHGKLGAAVVVSYFLVGIAGGIFLNPDFGIAKTNKTIRLGHKWGGRFLTMLAWTTSVLGFLKIQQDPIYKYGLIIPLLVLGYFTLL